MTKNILITGANGQLGSEMQVIFSAYPQFRFFPTDAQTLNLCHKKDIVDFIETNGIHYIVNCAAYTSVDKAEDDQEACFLINRDCVRNLAEAASCRAKIIHISTDYVFDGKANIPYVESDVTNPQSVYGKSKLEGEEVLMQICPESIIVRTSWLYSAFGNNFVKTMIRLGKERDSLNVVADQIGTPTYAADLAKTIMDIISWSEKENQFPSGIYHFSNEGSCSWYDFALKIHELSGITSCKVNPVPTTEYPTKASRPMYSILDKKKIQETFQINIPEWKESLEKLIINFI